MTFGAYDAQPAERDDLFLLLVAYLLERVIVVAEHLFGFAHRVIVVVVRRGCHFDDFGGETVALHALLRLEFRIAAQHDVRAAPRHIGGYRNSFIFACLRDDLRFLFVEFGVQHVMTYALAFEHIAELLGLLDADRADQNGLSFLEALLDVGNDCA